MYSYIYCILYSVSNFHYFLDNSVWSGAAPRVLPQGDVELHGPHCCVLCHHLLHHGHDVS